MSVQEKANEHVEANPVEANKDVIRRYLEKVWGEGDWGVAEEIVDENVVFHDQVREGDLPAGREGLREAMRRVRTGMPDFVMQVGEIVAERDIVVIRWAATGTHAGDFNGFPATGRVSTLYAISMVRMQDGRIVEGWQEADRLGMAMELGMVPSGGMPAPVAWALSSGVRLRDRLSRRREVTATSA